MSNIEGRKIKIIYVAPSLDAGGAEKFLVDLISNLNSAEFEFKLVLFSHAGFFMDDLVARGVAVKLIKKRFKIDLINFCCLYNFIRKNKPDIVHTQLGGDVYGRLIAWLLGVRTIISTEVGINKDEGILMRVLKIFTAHFATKIVAVSEAVRRDVVSRYLVTAKRVAVIYNGLDTAKFSQLKPRIRTSNKIVFGGVGRLAPEKNWPTLLRAIALMKNKTADCVVAGAGDMKLELEALALDLGISRRVKFIGLIKDVPALMADLDFFVLASTREAFGIVLIEAGMAALPVVAAAVGGITEIVHNNQTGFLFDPYRPSDLAERLDYLADHIDDPKIKKMGLDLQKFVRDNFDIKTIVVKYENLYKELYGRKN